MYTQKELKIAADIIKQIARQHNQSEAQVRADMQVAMKLAQNHPAPSVQAHWKTFHFAGSEPTVEEFILWTASQSLQNTTSFLPQTQDCDTMCLC